MNTDIMLLAANVWAETALAVLPVFLVFTLGNRILSMILNAFEGRGIRL